MKIKMIEATNVEAGGFNWGKFMVCRLESEEWDYQSPISESRLLQAIGWGRNHIFVVDLQTGEGARFMPGGLAVADLFSHKIWVCPMFEPFLEWLYKQDLSDLDTLPAVVEIADPKSNLRGYRRPGRSVKAS
jgi:hypothetical protein